MAINSLPSGENRPCRKGSFLSVLLHVQEVICSCLAKTGLLGKPGSYFYAYPANEVLHQITPDALEAYLNELPDRLQKEQQAGQEYSRDLYWLYETNLLHHLRDPKERMRYFYEHLRAGNIMDYLDSIRASDLAGEHWGIKILSNDNKYEGGFEQPEQCIQDLLQFISADPEKAASFMGVDELPMADERSDSIVWDYYRRSFVW